MQIKDCYIYTMVFQRNWENADQGVSVQQIRHTASFPGSFLEEEKGPWKRG